MVGWAQGTPATFARPLFAAVGEDCKSLDFQNPGKLEAAKLEVSEGNGAEDDKDAAVARLGVHGRLDPGSWTFGEDHGFLKRCGRSEIFDEMTPALESANSESAAKRFERKKVELEKLVPKWRQKVRMKKVEGANRPRSLTVGRVADF